MVTYKINGTEFNLDVVASLDLEQFREVYSSMLKESTDSTYEILIKRCKEEGLVKPKVKNFPIFCEDEEVKPKKRKKK